MLQDLRRERDATVDQVVDMQRAIREFCEGICCGPGDCHAEPFATPIEDCPLYRFRGGE
jgi:hypothetical protein